MIERLLLFGATGDLAGRYLLPALASLRAASKLPDAFRVVATAAEDLDDEGFRHHARRRLDAHAADVPAAARDDLVRSLAYRRLDLGDPEAVGGVVASEPGPLAAYLALPPELFAAAVTALGEAGLPAGSRIAVEKPFGEDLAGALELNALLARTAPDGEKGVFRVDHVLGMATAWNMLAMRLGNPAIESIWNGSLIERVEILWEETLALEGRAGYYDGAGALKDVMQNHMLQVLCLFAIEPPASLAEADLRDRKVELLRSVRPPPPDEMASRTRRARYTAGRIGEREIADYAREEGVDPRRRTETFAEVEVEVELEGDRWRGTRFLLRAGKALRRTRKGVVVRFRPADAPIAGAESSELWIGIDGPEDRAAYGRVLLDVLAGDGTLSVGGEEAELSWRVVTPVLEAWSEDRVPLEEYAAGSAGP